MDLLNCWFFKSFILNEVKLNWSCYKVKLPFYLGVWGMFSLTITGLNIDRRCNGLFHRKLTVGSIAPPDGGSGLEPVTSSGEAAPEVAGPIWKESLIEPKMPKLSRGNLSLIWIVGATRRGKKSCIWNNKEKENDSKKKEKNRRLVAISFSKVFTIKDMTIKVQTFWVTDHFFFFKFVLFSGLWLYSFAVLVHMRKKRKETRLVFFLVETFFFGFKKVGILKSLYVYLKRCIEKLIII